MKYVNFCLVVIVSLIFISSSTKTSRTSTGYYPGEQIPNIVLNGLEGKNLDLNDYKGEKVVLNFWAAYDASSRARNVQLHNFLKEYFPDVTFVSVAFDENENVFEKTLLLDEIESANQFCDTAGTQSDIYKKLRLNKEFKNYLLDENGVIRAINLTPEKLQNLL